MRFPSAPMKRRRLCCWSRGNTWKERKTRTPFHSLQGNLALTIQGEDWKWGTVQGLYFATPSLARNFLQSFLTSQHDRAKCQARWGDYAEFVQRLFRSWSLRPRPSGPSY